MCQVTVSCYATVTWHMSRDTCPGSIDCIFVVVSVQCIVISDTRHRDDTVSATRHCVRLAYLEISKGGTQGYISGVRFQKYSNISIRFFHINNAKKIFTPKVKEPPKYAPAVSSLFRSDTMSATLWHICSIHSVITLHRHNLCQCCFFAYL